MEYLESLVAALVAKGGDQMDDVLADPPHLISRQPAIDANSHGSNCKAD
jgi:hypothetical protein